MKLRRLSLSDLHDPEIRALARRLLSQGAHVLLTKHKEPLFLLAAPPAELPVRSARSVSSAELLTLLAAC